MSNDKKNLNEMTKDEIKIRERIESGEEIEITKAIEIMFMIKDNISYEQISKKTGRPISDVVKVQNILLNN